MKKLFAICSVIMFFQIGYSQYYDIYSKQHVAQTTENDPFSFSDYFTLTHDYLSNDDEMYFDFNLPDLENKNDSLENETMKLKSDLIKSKLELFQTTNLSKNNTRLKEHKDNLKKIRSEYAALYDTSKYKSLYTFDANLDILFSSYSAKEKRLSDTVENQISRCKLKMSLLEEKINNYKKEDTIKNYESKKISAQDSIILKCLESIQNTISGIEDVRKDFKAAVELRRKPEETETEDPNLKLQPLIDLIAPATSIALIQPKFTLRGQLALDKTKQGKQVQGINAQIFSAEIANDFNDSMPYSDLRKTAIQNLLLPEKSAFGVKVEYARKFDFQFSEKDETDKQFFTFGLYMNGYYLNKAMPLLDTLNTFTRTDNSGFIHFKPGLSISIYNENFLVYVNGNYLVPVTNVSSGEEVLEHSFNRLVYFDSGVRMLLNFENNLLPQAYINLNFIHRNGEINALLPEGDKLVPTLGIGLGF